VAASKASLLPQGRASRFVAKNQQALLVSNLRDDIFAFESRAPFADIGSAASPRSENHAAAVRPDSRRSRPVSSSITLRVRLPIQDRGIQFLTSSEAASTFSCRNRFPVFRRIQLYALSRSSTEPNPRTRFRPIAGAFGSEIAHPPLMGRHSNRSSSRRCSGESLCRSTKALASVASSFSGNERSENFDSRLAPEPPPFSPK